MFERGPAWDGGAAFGLECLRVSAQDQAATAKGGCGRRCREALCVFHYEEYIGDFSNFQTNDARIFWIGVYRPILIMNL
jgi:hypothetical protein